MAALRAFCTPHDPSILSDTNGESKLDLIELFSDGTEPRANNVTRHILNNYIENDFQWRGHKPEKHTGEAVRLFFSARSGKYDGEILPIPVSPTLFSKIAPFARIPRVYLDCLKNHTAIQIFAIPSLPSHLYTTSIKSLREEYISVILHSVPGAADYICLGASFTYHFPTRTMYIFMHTLESSTNEKFLSTLTQGPPIPTGFLIPSLLIQFNLRNRLSALDAWHERIFRLEQILKIRWDAADFHERDVATIDYAQLSRDINSTMTNIGFIIWQCRTTERLLVFLDEVVQRYRVQALANGFPADEVDDTEFALKESHQHLRSWNKGIEDRADYLSRRGTNLAQTVYSGIAQRDSANSISIASTSTKLAETSQEVAIATSRDSSVMRVIAAITIFFLPATFTATFFSTTFFDFNAGPHEHVYSWWLWLYFLTTIVLTTVVVAGAWLLWKSKEREIASRYVKSKEE